MGCSGYCLGPNQEDSCKYLPGAVSLRPSFPAFDPSLYGLDSAWTPRPPNRSVSIDTLIAAWAIHAKAELLTASINDFRPLTATACASQEPKLLG